jgi:hypothetical protein
VNNVIFLSDPQRGRTARDLNLVWNLVKDPFGSDSYLALSGWRYSCSSRRAGH